jgi:hypothetical protein
MEPSLLRKRLVDIGRSLEGSGHALALIGLGSAGLELERLDAYSDLDFFVIVEPGHKRTYLDELQWLSRLCPIAYGFANTKDGYKILFADGVFCEFAVFEPEELRAVPSAPGRVVWRAPHAPANVGQPGMAPVPPPRRDPDWLLGEALTNLWVGLARDRRGERLSALRFIQGYAVERVLELADSVEAAQGAPQDVFAVERRFEQRHPGIAREAASWLQGYERNRESALAILDFLEQHFEVNRAMAQAIRGACASCP